MATSSSSATFAHLESEQRVLVSVAVGMETQPRDWTFCFDDGRVGRRNMRRPQGSQRVSDPEQLEQLERARREILLFQVRRVCRI